MAAGVALDSGRRVTNRRGFWVVSENEHCQIFTRPLPDNVVIVL
jgi:hypothetical protein